MTSTAETLAGNGRLQPQSDDASAFAVALRRTRERAGLSQIQLALRAGYDYSYVSRLESGSRSPTRRAVLALAAALGCTPAQTDELLWEAGYVPESPALVAHIGRLLRTERYREMAAEAWKAKTS